MGPHLPEPLGRPNENFKTVAFVRSAIPPYRRPSVKPWRTFVVDFGGRARRPRRMLRLPRLSRGGARDQLLQDDDAEDHNQERQIEPAGPRHGAAHGSEHRLGEVEQDTVQRRRGAARPWRKPREDRSSEKHQEIEL